MSSLEPFYVADGGRLVATVSTRGPWSAAHQHGGPPAALCARALEALVTKDSAIARLTFDFVRPVPIAPLAVRAEVTRAGAKVQRLRATLVDDDGRELITASAVALRTARVASEACGDATDAPPPPPGAGAPFEFPFFPDPVGYHRAIEGRIVRGTWGAGPVAAWLRSRVALVAGETASPLQRLLIAADSASGVAVAVDQARYSFVNADLTVTLHRMPEGEWVCLDATTAVEPHGVALTCARLWDTRGPVGASLQTLLIEPR